MGRNRILTLASGVVLALFLAGCGKDQPTSFDNKDKKDGEHHGHTHDRKDAMIEDVTLPGGKKCHAGFTTHLSKKDGNELDVFFETTDEKEPKPVTLPEMIKLTGLAIRGDETYVLKFEPTEKDERKTDPDGQCSRFTAKAPWMKHEDMLTIKLTIEGVVGPPPVWEKFNPKQFAHVDE